MKTCPKLAAVSVLKEIKPLHRVGSLINIIYFNEPVVVFNVLTMKGVITKYHHSNNTVWGRHLQEHVNRILDQIAQISYLTCVLELLSFSYLENQFINITT